MMMVGREMTKLKMIGRGLGVGLLGTLAFGAAAANPLHVGAEFGYQHLSTGVPDEVGKNGVAALLRGGALFPANEWEFQADLGLRYSTLSGTKDGVSRKIKFLSGWAELGARYRLDADWSLGPVLDIGYGADMTHTEVPEASQSVLAMLGASARFAIPDSPLSLTLALTTDANLKDQTLWVTSVGVLWHFGQEEKAAKPSTLALEEPAAAVAEPRAEVEVAENYILLRIPEDVLLFETGMSHLSKAQKEYVGRLGAVLVQKSDRWQTIEVSGHTDFRGSDAVNNELSEGRAKSVRNELLSSGIEEPRITWFGRGETSPLTTEKDPESLARNRRVELKIEGIIEGSDLADELVSISPTGPTGY
jgi:outer membrane protein OmpA-like peptidoglycan-associated protein